MDEHRRIRSRRARRSKDLLAKALRAVGMLGIVLFGAACLYVGAGFDFRLMAICLLGFTISFATYAVADWIIYPQKSGRGDLWAGLLFIFIYGAVLSVCVLVSQYVSIR